MGWATRSRDKDRGDAGKLDRRITFLRYSSTLDDDLQPIEVWTADASPVWVSWRRASARETLAGAEVSAAATDVFEIRYSTAVADINPKDRLQYQGDTYDIKSVAEIGRREGLRIDGAKRADL